MTDEQSLVKLVKAVVDEVMEEAKERAIARSSGPLTLIDRIELGYPYSRRHGAPLRDPGLINYDPFSGAEEEGRQHFRDTWVLGATRVEDGKVIGDLRNENPVADELTEGNARTFGRPIGAETLQWAEEEIARRLKQVLEA